MGLFTEKTTEMFIILKYFGYNCHVHCKMNLHSNKLFDEKSRDLKVIAQHGIGQWERICISCDTFVRKRFHGKVYLINGVCKVESSCIWVLVMCKKINTCCFWALDKWISKPIYFFFAQTLTTLLQKHIWFWRFLRCAEE